MDSPLAQIDFDLSALLNSIECGAAVTIPGIDYVRTLVHGEVLHFAVSQRRDVIQNVHRRGHFYEEKELALIRSVLPVGGVFLDIGANVGNHAIYVAKFLHAARVVAIEPNPEACRYLIANVLMNGLERKFDLKRLGVGLSDEPGQGFSLAVPPTNMGGAQMKHDGGALRVEKGDDLLEGISPNFVKIDVEGMEMKVLSGLSKTINRSRPALLVEVDNENADAFHSWAELNAYKVRARNRRYRSNENFLLVPRRRRAIVTELAGGSR